VEEARERVLSKIEPLQPLELPLSEAYGCVPPDVEAFLSKEG